MAARIQAIQRDQSKGSPVSSQSQKQSNNQSNNQSINRSSNSNNRSVQRNPTQTSQKASSRHQQSDQSIHSPFYIPSDSPTSRSSPNALLTIDIGQALPHSVPLSSSPSNSTHLHFDQQNPMSDRQTIQHPLQTINQTINPNDPIPPPQPDWQQGERFDIDTTDESDYEDEEQEQDDDDDYGSEDDSPRSGRVLTFADEHGDNLCHILTYDPHAYQNPTLSNQSDISQSSRQSSISSVNHDEPSDAAIQAQLHAQKIAREREKRTQRNDAEAACQCSIQ